MTVEEMIGQRTAALQTALAAANAVKGGTASASVSALADDLGTELTAANAAVSTKGGGVIAQNLSRLPLAIASIPQGSSVTVEPLSVTDNGTYTADQGKAYSPVTVNVPSGGNPNMFVYEVPTTTNTLTITHSLGVAPTRAACICMDTDVPELGTQKLIIGASNVGNATGKSVYYNASGSIDSVNNSATTGFVISQADATSMTLTVTRMLAGGSTYLFIFS